MAEIEDQDLLEEARELFTECQTAEEDNRNTALDDMRFVYLREQWPEKIKDERNRQHRPCLTFDNLNPYIRQVVNDARLNKPAIKVHPVDSEADPETAKVISELIRNIEYTSNASAAYDQGIEHACIGGWGYWSVDVDYAYDDSFDQDIKIKRITNPFSVYGDPRSTAPDSSDWNVAFVVERLTEGDFEAKYNNAEPVDWEGLGYVKLDNIWWSDSDGVQVAEWWTREEYDRPICLLNDGTIVDKDRLEQIDPELGMPYTEIIAATGRQIVAERTSKSHKVKQRIITGCEVLEETEWVGRYIPIVPIYGEEFDLEGRRHFRSMIHGARDAQMNFNFWQTTATELMALAPRAPWIGPKGFAKSDPRWSTANSENHPYLEFDGGTPPTRNQAFDPGAAAALQQAVSAQNAIQRILGVFDASIGAPSNEKSGRAIMARQREGDVSTFHFIDNQARAIAHTGRILLDLIPAVYSRRKMLRILGENGEAKDVKLNEPIAVEGPNGPKMERDQEGNEVPMMRIHDLAVGKYDLTVSTGPSFNTRREEAAQQMTDMVRAMPDIAPIVMDLIATNLDWPGADEIAERFKAMVPQQAQDGIPPQIKEQMAQAQQAFAKLQAENSQLKNDRTLEQAKLKIEAFKAETERLSKISESSAERANIKLDLFKTVTSQGVMQ
jgi:hypothetical protein